MMICVSFGENIDELHKIYKSIDMAEIRLDLCKSTARDRILKAFDLPVKSIAAGCRNCKSGREEISLIKDAVLAGAAYIDLNTDNEYDLIMDTSSYARHYNSRVILSYHDFEKTPGLNRLKATIGYMLTCKPDIIKIAVKADSTEDNAKVLSLYSYFNEIKEDNKCSIISIGMGHTGMITRFAAVFMGAPFTYASAFEGAGTAEGQVDYQKMNSFLNSLTVI